MNGLQLIEALDAEGPNGVRTANYLMSEWGGNRWWDGIDVKRLRAATDKDLLKIPGIGPRALADIRKFVPAPKQSRKKR